MPSVPGDRGSPHRPHDVGFPSRWAPGHLPRLVRLPSCPGDVPPTSPGHALRRVGDRVPVKLRDLLQHPLTTAIRWQVYVLNQL